MTNASEPPPEPTYDGIASPVRSTLDRIVANGMAASSLLLYARWWQLEGWLRDLVYTELRAKHGKDWEKTVGAATGRLKNDATFNHMAGPDSENPVAYLDYSQLLRVIDDEWTLFEKALFARSAWDGRQAELKQIRHRIAHVRRPAADDVNRIELLLRDLEGGAFTTIADYNSRFSPRPDDRNDPVADGWITRRHRDARRLVDHAQAQYGTTLQIRCSFRPWASPRNDLRAGKLWHADFFLSDRGVDIGELWRDIGSTSAAGLLLDVNSAGHSHVGFTFSAADDENDIADAIGTLFEGLLTSGRVALDQQTWNARASVWSEMDFRIRVNTAWNIVDSTTLPIDIFGAGGGTVQAPHR